MARKGRSKARAAPEEVVGFLFSCTTDPRAKLSDCINVDALNEEHLGRGNSKSKAKLALAAIVECMVGLEYLDLPAARLIFVTTGLTSTVVWRWAWEGMRRKTIIMHASISDVPLFPR